MENFNFRLQALESKINPKTTSFKIYSENSLNKLDLISEQIILQINRFNLIKLIFGPGIFPEKYDKAQNGKH